MNLNCHGGEGSREDREEREEGYFKCESVAKSEDQEETVPTETSVGVRGMCDSHTRMRETEVPAAP